MAIRSKRVHGLCGGVVAAAVVGAAVLGSLAMAPVASAQGKQFYGVVIPGSDSIARFGARLDAQDYDRMRAGGVGTARLMVSWREVEQTPGSFQWDGLDQVIGNLAARRIHPLPAVNLPPDHVSTPPVRPADRGAFRRFMSQLVRRYGWGGRFWRGRYQAMFASAKPLPVRSWQLFNEQNARHHWRGRPAPRCYARLVRTGSRASSASTRTPRSSSAACSARPAARTRS